MMFKKLIRYNYQYVGKLYAFDTHNINSDTCVQVSELFTISFYITQNIYCDPNMDDIIDRCKREIINNNQDISKIVNGDYNLLIIDYRKIEFINITSVFEVAYDEKYAINISDDIFVRKIPLESNISITVDFYSIDDVYDKIKQRISEISGVDKHYIRLLGEEGN